jgi:uncharacterized membrane protein (UPF0127 family)/acyl carrier protein
MITCNAQNVRGFILRLYGERLKSAGLAPEAVSNDFDLLTQGIVDSLGVLELINAIEAEFNVVIDLEGLDAESLTIIGPLCNYIGRNAQLKEPMPNAAPSGAQPMLPTVKLRVGHAEIIAEIASTPAQIDMGLRFRQQLSENQGMLFVFPSPQLASFWMKDCRLALSIAFLDPDGTMLEIHDLQPNSENWVRSASEQVRFALEAHQGWFQRRQLTPDIKVQTDNGSLAERFPT